MTPPYLDPGSLGDFFDRVRDTAIQDNAARIVIVLMTDAGFACFTDIEAGEDEATISERKQSILAEALRLEMDSTGIVHRFDPASGAPLEGPG